MSRFARALGLALAAGALLGSAALGCGPSESPAATYARDPQAIKRGRLIFIGSCGAYCHAFRPGVRDAPYLFDCHWKHGDRDPDLFRVISAVLT